MGDTSEDDIDSNHDTDYHMRILEEFNAIRNSVTRRLQRQFNLIDEKYNVSHQMLKMKDWSKEHPVISVFLLATVLICFLPLLCFITSIMGFSFVVICSFIFVGGAIATLCIIVVGAILLFGAFVSFGFTTLIVIGYFIFQNVIDLANRIKNSVQSEDSKKEV